MTENIIAFINPLEELARKWVEWTVIDCRNADDYNSEELWNTFRERAEILLGSSGDIQAAGHKAVKLLRNRYPRLPYDMDDFLADLIIVASNRFSGFLTGAVNSEIILIPFMGEAGVACNTVRETEIIRVRECTIRLKGVLAERDAGSIGPSDYRRIMNEESSVISAEVSGFQEPGFIVAVMHTNVLDDTWWHDEEAAVTECLKKISVPGLKTMPPVKPENLPVFLHTWKQLSQSVADELEFFAVVLTKGKRPAEYAVVTDADVSGNAEVSMITSDGSVKERRKFPCSPAGAESLRNALRGFGIAVRQENNSADIHPQIPPNDKIRFRLLQGGRVT